MKRISSEEHCASVAQLSKNKYADVAQLAEQLTCNQQVIGSSPIVGLVPFDTSKDMDL